jgi:hypothetical protein
MGWFTFADEAVAKLFQQHKQECIDRKPKTDTLQPDQPAGDTSMATVTMTTNLTPYAANTGVVALPSNSGPYYTYTPAGQLGAGQYVGAANAVYAYGNSPQYVTAAYPAGGLHGMAWPIATLANNGQWFEAAQLGAQPIQPVDRSEFSEEEISQAEKLMEELSA